MTRKDGLARIKEEARHYGRAGARAAARAGGKNRGASRRGRRGPAALLLVGAFVSVYTAWLLVDQGRQMLDLAARRAEVEARVQGFKLANSRLAAEMEEFKKDDYVERVAREELGLIKLGEIPYAVSFESPDTPRTPGAQ